MSDYICRDCGHLFDAPLVFQERYPAGDGCVTETWCICPECGSSDYTPVTFCPCCGEAAVDDKELCPECKRKADFALVCFYSALEETQQAYLDEHRLGDQLAQAVKEILQEEQRQLQGGTTIHGNQETC